MSASQSWADQQFDAGYFEQLVAARTHWWVEGMCQIADAVLGPPRRDLRVLDAGVGSGALLDWLRSMARPGWVVGVDVARAGLAYSKGAASVAQASTTDLPLRDGQFDLVVSTDVLQHLTEAQERAALDEVARVLAPGGRFLVRTNAAFGRGEVAQRDDWRIYDPSSLTTALERSGLVVERITSANLVLGAYASLRDRLRTKRERSRTERHDAAGGHHHHHGRAEWDHVGLGIPRPEAGWRNALLLRVLVGEARWVRSGRSLPFGHSLYAVARRP